MAEDRPDPGGHTADIGHRAATGASPDPGRATPPDPGPVKRETAYASQQRRRQEAQRCLRRRVLRPVRGGAGSAGSAAAARGAPTSTPAPESGPAVVEGAVVEPVRDVASTGGEPAAATLTTRLDPPTALHLLVVNPTGRNTDFMLPAGRYLVGRAPDCELPIPDPSVSRHHVRIVAGPGEVTVEDLGSTNGTRVNGERIGSVRMLHTGDRVELGSIQMQVQLAAGS